MPAFSAKGVSELDKIAGSRWSQSITPYAHFLILAQIVKERLLNVTVGAVFYGHLTHAVPSLRRLILPWPRCELQRFVVVSRECLDV